MAKKKLHPQVDGLGPRDKEKIVRALRQVWAWSYPRRLCIARATDKDGLATCENPKCPQKGKKLAKVYADHINPLGSVDSGIIDRMWCPSTKLQAWCKKCHDKKTREENKAKLDAAKQAAWEKAMS